MVGLPEQSELRPERFQPQRDHRAWPRPTGQERPASNSRQKFPEQQRAFWSIPASTECPTSEASTSQRPTASPPPSSCSGSSRTKEFRFAPVPSVLFRVSRSGACPARPSFRPSVWPPPPHRRRRPCRRSRCWSPASSFASFVLLFLLFFSSLF